MPPKGVVTETALFQTSPRTESPSQTAEPEILASPLTVFKSSTSILTNLASIRLLCCGAKELFRVYQKAFGFLIYFGEFVQVTKLNMRFRMLAAKMVLVLGYLSIIFPHDNDAAPEGNVQHF